MDTRVSFVPMASIRKGGGLISPPIRSYHEMRTGFTMFREGDILVSKITPCFENRKVALVSNLSNGYGFGSTELHVLRARSSCSARYLFYVLTSDRFRARGMANMTGSAGQRRVPAGFIRNYQLRIPDLGQQEHIADVLGLADHRLELLRRKLCALRTLKKGLMQKLLGAVHA